MELVDLAFTLHGAPVRWRVRSDLSLLDALREHGEIRSLRDGCQPQGQCGCCVAMIDGQAKTTCATPVKNAQGKDIVTLEGIAAEDRALLARAFSKAAGVQCGFCIPGIAMRAK